MAYKDINTKKEYDKKYRKENKEKFREYDKKYYQKNKEEKKIYMKKYRQNNIEKIKKRTKKYYQENKDAINKKCKEYYKKRGSWGNLQFWEGFIPKETNCQICGRKIYFNRKNRVDAICFDHKEENILIKGNPTIWLRSNKRTLENQKIWESCKFGILCNRCNVRIPSKNREQFVRNTVKYVFGNNATIIH